MTTLQQLIKVFDWAYQNQVEPAALVELTEIIETDINKVSAAVNHWVMLDLLELENARAEGMKSKLSAWMEGADNVEN
jgi:hypothetical protein